MLKTALALLLIGIPCFAQRPQPTVQIIPLLPEGEGWFSTVTLTNDCGEPLQDLRTAFITNKGEVLKRETVGLHAGRSWSADFHHDSTPMTFFYAVVIQTDPKACPVTMSAEENVLKGDKVKSLAMHSIRVESSDVAHGVYRKAVGEDLLINLVYVPGSVSTCSELTPDGTDCAAWKDYTIAPLTMIRLDDSVLLFQKKSDYIFSSHVDPSAGTTRTYSADSSITFGTQ